MDGANWLSLRNQYQNSYYISWSLNWSQIVRWCTWSRYEENNETHNQLHPTTALLLTQKIGGLSELPICLHTDARIIIMTKGRAGRIDHGQLSYPSHIDARMMWYSLRLRRTQYSFGMVGAGYLQCRCCCCWTSQPGAQYLPRVSLGLFKLSDPNPKVRPRFLNEQT